MNNNEDNKVDRTEVNVSFDDRFGCTVFMICVTVVIITLAVIKALS